MDSSIDYNQLPDVSRLFNDFISDNDAILKRFPNNRILSDEKALKSRAIKFGMREELLNSVKSSMSYVTFTENQDLNFDLLGKNNTLAIVSGQQVGFLGGPLYSLYKILSSISLATELNEKYSDLNVVPVFWIEDNDHDIEEAAEISLLNYKLDINDYSCVSDSDQSDRTIVAEKSFNDNISANIDKIINNLPNTINRSQIAEDILNIYQSGKYWRAAFIELLQRWVGELGVLFVCASCLRKNGLYKNLIIKELINSGSSERLTLAANHDLDTLDYHIQAKASPINLFYHIVDERFRIDLSINNDFLIADKIYSKTELLEIATEHPERFSPKVLLRPVFQDALIPTAAYVAGPGETGYLAQTKELFEHFEVQMPAIVPRHSFTLIDKKTSKFLDKQGLSPDYFFRDKQVIINEIGKELLEGSVEEILEDSKNRINEIFKAIALQLKEIEPGLENSTNAASTKSLQQIDVLEKKATSAMKRKKEDTLMRYELAGNFLYPKNTMQERIFSPLSMMIFTGEKEFIKIIMEAVKKDRRRHHFIEIF